MLVYFSHETFSLAAFPAARVRKPLYWNMDSAGNYILWMMQITNKGPGIFGITCL